MTLALLRSADMPVTAALSRDQSCHLFVSPTVAHVTSKYCVFLRFPHPTVDCIYFVFGGSFKNTRRVETARSAGEAASLIRWRKRASRQVVRRQTPHLNARYRWMWT